MSHTLPEEGDTVLLRRSAAEGPTGLEAFRRLFLRIQTEMLRVARGFLWRIPDFAADAVQEAAVEFWQRSRDLPEGQRFRPWAFWILKCRCIDQLRRKRPRALPEEGPAAARPGPETQLLRREEYALLHEAIDRLPELQREALRLRLAGELSAAEIARQLAIPERTLRYHVAAALTQLRAWLGEADPKGLEPDPPEPGDPR